MGLSFEFKTFINIFVLQYNHNILFRMGDYCCFHCLKIYSLEQMN